MDEDLIEKARREGAEIRKRIEADSEKIVSDYAEFLGHKSEQLASSGGYHPLYLPKSWLPYEKYLIELSFIKELDKAIRSIAHRAISASRESAELYIENLKTVLGTLSSYVDDDWAEHKKKELQKIVEINKQVIEEIGQRSIDRDSQS